MSKPKRAPDWVFLLRDEDPFKRRTKQYGLRIICLVQLLPSRRGTSTIGRQLLRTGTSVGANCWAPCRGRSRADTLSKLAIVEAGCVPKEQLRDLMIEGDEIVAMTVASIKTLRKRQ